MEERVLDLTEKAETPRGGDVKTQEVSSALVEYRDPSALYTIQSRSIVEVQHDQSLVKGRIQLITDAGAVVAGNSRQIVAMGSRVMGSNAANMDIMRNVTAGTVVTDLASDGLTQGGVNNLQIAGQVVQVVGTALTALYIGYQLYDGLRTNFAKVACYNMFEWVRINIQFPVPHRPHPTFNLVDKDYSAIHYLNGKYCSYILYNGDLQNCRDQYNGILLFILGNFIYNIDGILEGFLRENKAQLFTSALMENNYAVEHFEERKRDLCYHRIIRLVVYIAQTSQLPLDSEGLVGQEYMERINQYILDCPSTQSEYIKGSIFCFLFKTLDFAVRLLRQGKYKFSDYHKTDLFRYVIDKDDEWSKPWKWSKSWKVWALCVPHYVLTQPEKSISDSCSTLADLEAYERFGTDNEIIESALTVSTKAGVSYKRLLPFTVNEAAKTFIDALSKDEDNRALIGVYEYKSSLGKNTLLRIYDSRQFKASEMEIVYIPYSEWSAKSI